LPSDRPSENTVSNFNTNVKMLALRAAHRELIAHSNAEIKNRRPHSVAVSIGIA
jgi:hypothetical protein